MSWEEEMVERLQAAKNGAKDLVIADYQAMTGKAPATLYRIAAKHGFTSGRKPRTDKGELKSGLNDGQLQFISTLIQTTAREVKGAIMPVEDALEIAVDSGVIPKGQISVARLQAILREREMNAAALDGVDPSIRMRSLHPNHVHVFDASICIQYYLKGNKGLRILDERDFREKKPANFAKIKERLIRMVLVDHFSHTIFVKYYVAAGENQRTTYDFLSSAWRGGHHEKFPFRGVPFFLLMDAGSANIAKGILGMLERLDIEIPKNMPHNPKRQGSAEVAQNIVEGHFEARLRLEPAHTIEDLNSWAVDWMVAWNGLRKHRRTKMPRTECWLQIRKDQLKELPAPEIMHDLYAEPEVTRKVRQDNTVSFRSNTYRLKHIPKIRPGKEVLVVLRPFHWPEVAVVFNETEYLVSPIGTVAGGFSADAAVIGEEFKAQPESTVQKLRKDNENLAYGEERKKGDVPFGGTLQVMGHQADKVRHDFLPRSGVPALRREESGIMEQEITMFELFKALNTAGIEVTPSLNSSLRERLGTSVSLADRDRLINELLTGEGGSDHAQIEGLSG